ncbi:hypothetical protein BKG84_09860 [Mycobacteroides chelonae]|uniref:Uncharacterized protein n=1 Tax=Mycobacteroides chelonae TaxID=1774 RepID=A0A1S1M608_MYCCH|nr:hypothetical protein BKG84_09860 [Mycobacteroides chelonae]
MLRAPASASSNCESENATTKIPAYSRITCTKMSMNVDTTRTGSWATLTSKTTASPVTNSDITRDY